MPLIDQTPRTTPAALWQRAQALADRAQEAGLAEVATFLREAAPMLHAAAHMAAAHRIFAAQITEQRWDVNQS